MSGSVRCAAPLQGSPQGVRGRSAAGFAPLGQQRTCSLTFAKRMVGLAPLFAPLTCTPAPLPCALCRLAALAHRTGLPLLRSDQRPARRLHHHVRGALRVALRLRLALLWAPQRLSPAPLLRRRRPSSSHASRTTSIISSRRMRRRIGSSRPSHPAGEAAAWAWAGRQAGQAGYYPGRHSDRCVCKSSSSPFEQGIAASWRLEICDLVQVCRPLACCDRRCRRACNTDLALLITSSPACMQLGHHRVHGHFWLWPGRLRLHQGASGPACPDSFFFLRQDTEKSSGQLGRLSIAAHCMRLALTLCCTSLPQAFVDSVNEFGVFAVRRAAVVLHPLRHKVVSPQAAARRASCLAPRS